MGKSKRAEQPAAAEPTGSQKGSRWRWKIAGIILLLIISLGGGLVFSDWWSTVPDGVEATYVGRGSCIECHQTEAKLFHGSHHDLAMDFATPETVRAKFDGTEIEHYGVVSRVFMDDDKFMVHTEGPDGEMSDFEVKYVFGYEPLQQYMVEFDRPEGMPEDEIARLQVLRLTWDTENERWFYLSPPDVDEKLEPDDPLHWTSRTQCWNTSCADCHSTNLRKNFDPKNKIFHTTFSEIDVSCEACHGPGSLHIELANSKSLFWDRKVGYGLAKLKGDSVIPQVETCAKCHSRREAIHDTFVPGQPFCNSYRNHLLTDTEYHADGQIKDEDYVYGSFIQSKMFHEGIRCSDCHDVHSTKTKFIGNAVCTSCHQHPVNKYDTPEHHKHEVGSTGALCVDCHMPETVYMDVDPRRDHSLRVPRPDLSVKLGTPNACVGCHLTDSELPAEKKEGLTQYLDWIIQAEQGNEVIGAELDRLNLWAADAVENWYGKKEQPEHFAEIFTEARKMDPDSIKKLSRLIAAPTTPAIVRATAAYELSRFSDEASFNTAVRALTDPDPTVVEAALHRIHAQLGALAQQVTSEEDQNRVYSPLADTITPLLHHSSRLVRIQSARVLTSFPGSVRATFAKSDREAYRNAFDELVNSVEINSDHGGAHAFMGMLHEERGEINKAIQAYQDGIHVEPTVAGPRRNLAAIYDRRAESANQQIASIVRSGQQEAAQDLAMEMMKDRQEAQRLRAEELEIVANNVSLANENMQGFDGLLYDYAMLLAANDRLAEADEALQRAYAIDPENIMYVVGLGALYVKLNQIDKAIEFAKKALELDPTNPSYIHWVQQLNAMKGNL